jgi:hypothetical protein
MGVLVPALTVLLIHQLWPDDLSHALLSGALVAVCGQLWQSSVVVMSDTTGLALATLSAVALVRYAKTGHALWLLLASAAIAYATLTRWIYGLVAVPFAIYALIVLLEAIRRWSRQAHSPINVPHTNVVPLGQSSAADPRSVQSADAHAVPPEVSAPDSASARLDATPGPAVHGPCASETASQQQSRGGEATPQPGAASGSDTSPRPPAETSREAPGSTAVASNITPSATGSPTLSPSAAVLHAAAALLIAALILVPAVAEPLIGLIRNPALPATFAGNFQVYSWSPLNALRHDFFTADGHLAYTQPNGLYYAIAPANFAYFGPLLAVWILPGLWAARHWQVRTLVLVVGWAASVFAFHAGAPWQNFRFALAYLPPAAILAAAGLLLAWRWFDTGPAAKASASVPLLHANTRQVEPTAKPPTPGDNLPRQHRVASITLRTLVAACLVLGLLTTAAAAARLVERFIDTKDQELALVHWVQSQTPANAELLTFGPTLTFRHYSDMPTYDLFDVTASELHEIVADPAHHYLLVDLGSVESQWLNQAPSTNYHLLRDEVGLRELGREGSYTLYEINAPTAQNTS